jgi:hypothetical protein|tara:strand:+ start:3961 stop:5082 length:1122 start_codon:yes stop_codon:yes gene_type:complete
MVAGVGKARKNAYIAFLRRAVDEDDAFADALATCSKDYQSWAKLMRARGRTDDAHDDACRLLDSKGHLLNIIDRVCEDVASGETTRESENARKVREAWRGTKKVQRAKFAQKGGAEGVAEARRREREAKERIKAARKERERRETRDKERKAARLEYATKVHEARSAGACLDWLNMGRCRFGEECQYEHDEMSKGILKDLAVRVGAETGDVKRERNQAEKAERKARAKALREGKRDSLGEHASSSDDESESEDESGSEDDMPGFLKIERARRAAEALLATNKPAKKKAGDDASTKGKPKKTSKQKHFNEKQLERKQKFLKEGKNQPLVKKGLKKRPAGASVPTKSPKKKKPRHADSERKKRRVGIERTYYGDEK